MRSLTTRNMIGILVLGLVMLLGVSTDAMAQRRGRRVSGLDKKCEKFVNCHDARDGRWDGRGPQRNRSARRIFRRTRRTRDDRVISRRGRHRNRDLSQNRSWRRPR